jgi:YHS domain-containing protein
MGSLVYFLIWGAAIFLMMRFGCGAHIMGHGHGHADAPSDENNASPNKRPLATPPENAVDPVCHMQVETAKAKSAVYGGKAYYFCSQDCRLTFEADPPVYLRPSSNSSIAQEHQHAN